MKYQDYYKRKLSRWWMDTDFRASRKTRRMLAKQARARVRRELKQATDN